MAKYGHMLLLCCCCVVVVIVCFVCGDRVLLVEYAEPDTFYCFTSLMSEIRDNFIKTLDDSACGIGKCHFETHTTLLGSVLCVQRDTKFITSLLLGSVLCSYKVCKETQIFITSLLLMTTTVKHCS